MPRSFCPSQEPPSFEDLFKPVEKLHSPIPSLESRGYRPFQMEFMHQLKALVAFHLEEHKSGRDLLQFLEQDDFARRTIAPPKGIKKSSFFEAINSRGLEQMFFVFKQLQAEATKVIPKTHTDLGELIAIDGSYIETVLSMHWADYSDQKTKAKVHMAFDLNRSIPSEIILTNGKVDERPFVSKLLSPGQTGVMDRGYQSYKDFDLWQSEGKHFVCRIRFDHQKTVISYNPVAEESIIFFDAVVLLGTKCINQSQKEVRLVGYRVDHKEYWIATDRFDLSAEQIAAIYKERWLIEKFFAWWKRHLKVYHIIARSRYGLTMQILAGLVTYLLLAIYCQNHFGERVSIKRVRQLRIQIRNELRGIKIAGESSQNFKEQAVVLGLAKT
jgi:Transposase DDE domain